MYTRGLFNLNKFVFNQTNFKPNCVSQFMKLSSKNMCCLNTERTNNYTLDNLNPIDSKKHLEFSNENLKIENISIKNSFSLEMNYSELTNKTFQVNAVDDKKNDEPITIEFANKRTKIAKKKRTKRRFGKKISLRYT
jgi:hypothetical protein